MSEPRWVDLFGIDPDYVEHTIEVGLWKPGCWLALCEDHGTFSSFNTEAEADTWRCEETR